MDFLKREEKEKISKEIRKSTPIKKAESTGEKISKANEVKFNKSLICFS